jgi:hypothetical protein
MGECIIERAAAAPVVMSVFCVGMPSSTKRIDRGIWHMRSVEKCNISTMVDPPFQKCGINWGERPVAETAVRKRRRRTSELRLWWWWRWWRWWRWGGPRGNGNENDTENPRRAMFRTPAHFVPLWTIIRLRTMY